MNMIKQRALLAAGLLAFGLGTAVYAQEGGLRVVVPADPKAWQKDPSIPHGAKTLVVYGDPKKAGPYMIRIRMPSGYKLQPHKFPNDLFVTVVKGTFWFGTGDRYNPMKMRELQGGSAFTIPQGTPSYSWARTEVILQVLGQGPVDNPIEYIHPDDDPRQQ
ncbi:MAG: cupin domain-containing protein [Burkholderiales bacterium]